MSLLWGAKGFTGVIKPDTFITMVSPMDKFGFMSLDYLMTMLVH
ncbi:hypothetical protein ACK3C2_01345 [Mycoplasmoides gallisepticum]